MTTMQAFDWIIYATKMSPRDLKELNLNPEQIRALGEALSRNLLLNPPSDIPEKTGAHICQQCNQVFIDTWRTKKPMYCYNCRR